MSPFLPLPRRLWLALAAACATPHRAIAAQRDPIRRLQAALAAELDDGAVEALITSCVDLLHLALSAAFEAHPTDSANR